MRISDWSSDVCSSDLADGDAALVAIEPALQRLNAARPTAVNLAWALARMRRALAGAGDDWRDMLEREARAIEVEDLAANRRMGELGAGLIEPGSGVLTHCNTGSLATAVFGTALDRKSTRLHSRHSCESRTPSSASEKKTYESQ